jgi:hypothetical protein
MREEGTGSFSACVSCRGVVRVITSICCVQEYIHGERFSSKCGVQDSKFGSGCKEMDRATRPKRANLNGFVCIVERLYCKRPTTPPPMSGVYQNIDPQPPPRPASVYPPPPPRLCRLWCGGGHTHWVERGWGVYIMEDARHCSVLYIRKYFVVYII